MGGETVGICVALLIMSALPGLLAVPTPSETFSSSTPLVKDDIYHLFWKSDNTSITFEVHAKVKGWVGFGLSPNGAMENADIVIGWVKDGVSYFKDRWGTGDVMPTIDQDQNWILLAASETDTHTILKFKRPLYSCDPYDRNVTEDTMRIIFAYSETDPSSENAVAYHGTTRGTKSISLLSQLPEAQVLPADAISYDVANNNITLPHNRDTTYWCSGHYPPAFTQKYHLIRVSPIIGAGNEAYVHHMLLYACYHLPSPKDNTPSGAVCGTGNMPRGTCRTMVAGWGVGGGDFYFPEHVGFPFGEPEGGILYLELEIHYDNPSLTPGIVDTSGMRLWFTSAIRTNDAGVLSAGMQVNPDLHILPAGYPSLMTVGHCSKDCLAKGMGNTSEIKVFADILHTHLAGIGLRLRHFRDGIELQYVDSDMNYDFNYQESRHRNPEVILKKGDSLSVECYYDTKDRDATTFAGLGTREEMCLAFLFYYPKIGLAWCASAPTQAQMAEHLSLKYRSTSPDTVVLSEGPYANKTFTEYMRNIVRFPDVATMNKYQEAIVTGEAIEFCQIGYSYVPRAQQAVLETPEVISPYTPVAKPCGLLSDSTGGSNPMPYNQGTSPVTSLGVLSLLIIVSIFIVM